MMNHKNTDSGIPKLSLNQRRLVLEKLRLVLFRYLIYPTWWRWAYNKRYVGQDKRVLESLYDGDEYFQGNDSGIIAWRRLSARARKGPDSAVGKV